MEDLKLKRIDEDTIVIGSIDKMALSFLTSLFELKTVSGYSSAVINYDAAIVKYKLNVALNSSDNFLDEQWGLERLWRLVNGEVYMLRFRRGYVQAPEVYQ